MAINRQSRGQALVELALGMFAMSLVAAALIGFAIFIAKGLNILRSTRVEAGSSALNSVGGSGVYSNSSQSDSVEVEPLATKYIFGSSKVKVKESVCIPKMGIMR